MTLQHSPAAGRLSPRTGEASPRQGGAVSLEMCNKFFIFSFLLSAHLSPPPTSPPPPTCPRSLSGSGRRLCLFSTGSSCSSPSSWRSPASEGNSKWSEFPAGHLHLLKLALEQTKLELLRAEPCIRVIVVQPFKRQGHLIIKEREKEDDSFQ